MQQKEGSQNLASNSFKWWELPLLLTVIVIYFYWLTISSFQQYFTIDDIHNISWSHMMTLRQFFRDAIDPRTMATTDTYRPIGALVYKIAFDSSKLDVFYYHLIAHCLHFVNICLVYLTVRNLGCTRLAAWCGSILFAFQPAMLPIYWEFSTIFDVVCAVLIFSILFLYIKTLSKGASWYYWMISILLFFLAVRTKEMAFVLPIILTFYELIFVMPSVKNRNTFVLRLLKRQAAYYCVALIYGLPKVFAASKEDQISPYHLVLSVNSFFEGFKYYLESMLNRTDIHIGFLIAMFLAFCGLAILLKQRIMMFSLLYTCISFLPVIFLAHHRWGAYWYIPFWGVALYSSNFFQIIQVRLLRSNVVKGLLAFSLFIICLWLNLHFNFEKEASSGQIVKVHQENYYLRESHVSRNFIEQLARLNLKPTDGTLLIFINPPILFDDVALGSIAKILYHDISIRVESAKMLQKLNDKDDKVFYILYKDGVVTKL